MFNRMVYSGRVDSGRVAYRCRRGGIFREGGVDLESEDTSHNHKKGGRYWERGIDSGSR